MVIQYVVSSLLFGCSVCVTQESDAQFATISVDTQTSENTGVPTDGWPYVWTMTLGVQLLLFLLLLKS